MNPLEALFYPRGVVVVGSTSPGKLGYELARQIAAGGYRQVYAVNPKAMGVEGVPAFVRVSAIPEPVDLAVIASPAAAVNDVLHDCGQAGVKAAVVITAGFSEAGNPEGEAELQRTARQYGMRLVGPNCAGIVNTRHNLFATLETRPPAGEVAFISQSGALGGAVLSWAGEQGLGIGKFVSYGNRADLDEIDLLPYLAQDPDTKVVALYIESVRDGRAFLCSAAEFTRVKPLVVIKSGRSAAGQRATLSHTGSLAGSDRVYDAALQACGAIRVSNIEEMFDLCRGFASLPVPAGRRLAIVTNSGGPGVLAADCAEKAGLETPEPSPGLKGSLSGYLSERCALRNPVDLTVEGDEAGYRRTLVEMLAGEYDAALAINVATPYLDSMSLARGVLAAARESGKPVAANFMAGPVVSESIAFLKANGIPNFATGERAATVIAHMLAWRERGQLPTGLDGVAVAPRKFPGARPVLEPQAMDWLAENGLPVPVHGFAASEDAALQVCREVAYPLVMKVVSPDILHKSDRGGVHVNIATEDGARKAFRSIRDAAHGCDFRGVVVYPMLMPDHEVFIGLKRDAQFGPLVLVGMGGIYTEVLDDVALRLAPVTKEGAVQMIRGLRGYPVLAGTRGKPRMKLDGLAAAVEAVSRLADLYPEIEEMDLNPVFMTPSGVTIGDVRVILKENQP